MPANCEKCQECFWCDCDVRKMAQEIFALEIQIAVLEGKDKKSLGEQIEKSFKKFTSIL